MADASMASHFYTEPVNLMGHKGINKRNSLYLIQQLQGAITNYLNLLSSGKLGGKGGKNSK